MKNSIEPLKLSLNDTQVLKGVALLLLLCHHCWYTGEGFDDVFVYGKPIFKQIGIFGKLCVSLFVFLSGYGLTIGAIKNNGVGNIMHFYRKRYVKLMINYWLIWLLFVPLGVFFFDRSFPSVYGDNYVFKALADFFGVHSIVIGNVHGYNSTWWFYSCIILFYLFYPLIWKYRKFWFLTIPLTLLVPEVCGAIPLRHGGVWGYLFSYSLSFVCGMLFANSDLPSVKFSIGAKCFMVGIFLLICFFRLKASNTVLWDSLICVWGVFVYQQWSRLEYVSKTFAFLGRHSFNIFLFHTFIYVYYFHDYIFWSRNPILIFATLLMVSIIISVLIEKLKEVLKINYLQKILVG